MRFLADEGCDFAVVRALRRAGHDVVAVLERCPGAEDERVIELAVAEARILLTEDKGFGELVYARARTSGGVIFVRFPAGARAAPPGAAVGLVETHGERLKGAFVVLQPGRARIGRTP